MCEICKKLREREFAEVEKTEIGTSCGMKLYRNVFIYNHITLGPRIAIDADADGIDLELKCTEIGINYCPFCGRELV